MSMKRDIFPAVFIAVVAVNGCASVQQPAVKGSSVGKMFRVSSYSGPKACLAIADVGISADKAGAVVGAGLRKMLITALGNSGRFTVVDVQSKEQEKADVTIAVTVSEFEPQASGGAAGIGGGGGVGSGLMGGLMGLTLHKASMELDVRIIDPQNSAVLAQTRVQGQATNMAGGFMAGLFGGWELDAGLAPYANSPMEKAIRICIIEATRYISQSIPERYYKK
jgi:curli biogenesis system outer membrane secretion channel CsgG